MPAGGGAGLTYGGNDVWQFYDEQRRPINQARHHWRTAIDYPGSFQAGYARKLFESRPFTRLVPAQPIIVCGQGDGIDHAQAACADDGSFLFVYLPTGKPITITMDAITGIRVAAHWYDPRTGGWQRSGELANTGLQQFIPPSSGRGNDWVLVLDDAEQGYPVGYTR
ncbi:MAG TPA: putative collagen-binding domain-containing protein [Armatimonadota bacterium]